MSRTKNHRFSNSAKRWTKEEYKSKSRARWRKWLKRVKDDPAAADAVAQPIDLECANYWNWD